MSTIIRVKRKFNEEQVVDEKIVLNIKRQRTDENLGKIAPKLNDEKTILKFAGTVDNTTNTEENILKLTKSDAERIVSRQNLIESKLQKRLSENKEKAQINRFKVLNYTRSSLKLQEESNEDLTIVDVEKHNEPTKLASAASSSTMHNDSSDSDYVYDIYIAEKTPSIILNSDTLDLNDLSILDYNDYLYSSQRLTNDSDEEECADSSDSNAEDYYTNDYPDEDDYSDNESIGEREMRRAMNNFDIGNDLSSSDNDDFIYSVDTEGIEFEDDLDFVDIERYGRSYAKYKKKNLKKMDSSDDDDD
ncbi:hypothetical protein PVAND_005776 [Polypedilum vanderplanki]|uniref:Probable RNA polymerase II nuclear localization protein SLC7A6OS n=1 Tax=Polypedilum vanderplanki TaxID=319348 RepID=A0A9J6C226_POLVA|nr:hypothetical protein PVAND_005776 [Polypedilum vanderplanki]